MRKQIGWIWSLRPGGYSTMHFLAYDEEGVDVLPILEPGGMWVPVYSSPPTDRLYTTIMVQLYTDGPSQRAF